MNYLPFCGYWFYGATSDNERANYFSSWGLLGDAPIGSEAIALFILHSLGMGAYKLSTVYSGPSRVPGLTPWGYGRR